MKIRGTASHIYEKYQTLARDASASGDRVAAENYLQHAEHYFRILSANAASQSHNQNQGPNHQQGQPEQQPQPGYHADGGANGRSRGNGQRMDVGTENDQDDDAGGVIRTLSRSDEARTVEPASSGPTSFEPLSDGDVQEQPEQAPAAATAEANAETGEESGEAQVQGSGRKKSNKEKTDAAPAN